MERMRVTYHNARAHKDGKPFRASHNDRQFDMTKADHIDQERTCQNRYWIISREGTVLDYEKANTTFEEHEKSMYRELFSDYLKARDERLKRSGHQSRKMTPEQYYGKKRTCPEACELYVGNKNNHLDAEELEIIAFEWIQHVQDIYPNFKLLDVSLHVDEATPHIDFRGVWVYHDADGHLAVCQEKALQEMGIEPPEPEKAVGRFNNAKMSFTRENRDFILDLAESFTDIERKPKERSRSGLSHVEYMARQEEHKAEKARETAEKARNTEMNTIEGMERKLKEWVGKLEHLSKISKILLDDTEKQNTIQELQDISGGLDERIRKIELFNKKMERRKQLLDKTNHQEINRDNQDIEI